nr:reverse transcriptase domain-containing protein [Tanacetum cinerariifolium]
MSTRSSARNLFPPLDNLELTIRRRSHSDPTLLNNSEMAVEGPCDLPETNFGLENDMIQQVQNSCQFHGLLDTFYNGLTLRHRDTINAAARGTFMKRRPEEFYDLIENMTAHHNDWDTSAQRSESSSSITSFDTEIAALKAEMAEINKNLMRVLHVNQQVKAVTPNCETYGGPHSFSDCPTTIGNTQNIYAAGPYQGNSYQPQGNRNLLSYRLDNYLGPPGLGTLPGNTITNLKEDLKGITTQSGTAYPGPTIPTTFSLVVECEAEVTKDKVHPTKNGSIEDVQPSVVPTKSLTLDSEPVTSPIIKPVASLVSAPRPNQTPSIPYPSRLQDQNLRRTQPSCWKRGHNFQSRSDFKILAIYNDMTTNHINVIDMACEEYSQEVLGYTDLIASGNPTSYYDPIVSTTSLTLTPFRNSDFLIEEVDAFLALEMMLLYRKLINLISILRGDILLLEAFLNDDPSLPPPNQGNYLPEVCKELKICEAKSDKSSIDEPLEIELKDLPPHLEYAFLEGDDKLPVIIAKDLSMEEKTALIMALKSHKRAIAWKLSDIKGINHEFCTHKTLIEEDFEPVVQHQRRVNPKIHDVIKQEVLKLLNAGLIYPISDSPWVSLVHCVPKKGGFTVVENEENKLILTPIQKIKRKPHSPAHTERLLTAACLLGYAMHQACFREKMLKRCEDTNLCLNWEKSHFMVKEGIALTHKISKEGIEVEKTKVDAITKLPLLTTVKESVYTAKKPLTFLRLATVDPSGDTMAQITQPRRKVQLGELIEPRGHAYENSLIYKEKTKRLHDSKIKDRVFNIDDRVILFNS